jgi:RHS repeat-associated protein
VPNPAYTYDANGNLISGGGRVFGYTSFNVPTCITNAPGASVCTHMLSSHVTMFAYDSDHRRTKQVEDETAQDGTRTTTTTYYINAGGVLTEYQKVQQTSAGVTTTTGTTWTSYLGADGQAIGMYVQPTFPSGQSSYTQYFHTHHLGSVVALTNDAGQLAQPYPEYAYDPWGKRRGLSGTPDTYNTLASLMTRGYTDQEHVATMALIHMNGRVYDPQIGKFTSADPLVSQLYSSQGWNRYAYVGNNPLNSTDPTGLATNCMNNGTKTSFCLEPSVELNNSFTSYIFPSGGSGGGVWLDILGFREWGGCSGGATDGSCTTTATEGKKRGQSDLLTNAPMV